MRRLQADADRLADGDLTASPAPAGGPPEMRALADSIAAMATRLVDLLAARRTFVVDASHQLRSPLTALKLRLENLQSRLTADELTELDVAMEETDRLGALVNDPLQLARADERPGRDAVDLARLAPTASTPRPPSPSRATSSCGTAGLDTPAVVEAVPGAIEQILENLLDNALNASSPGSTITVTSGLHEHQLHIADEGAGLDEGHKALATRRFWRARPRAMEPDSDWPSSMPWRRDAAGASSCHDASSGGLTATVSFQEGAR
jgi:signal transduction histidine kinase